MNPDDVELVAQAMASVNDWGGGEPSDYVAEATAVVAALAAAGRLREPVLNGPANGLFGPGIFGTGIDLSALDDDTAWRLGQFMGEQMNAAGAEAMKTAARALVALARKHGDRWTSPWDQGFAAGMEKAGHHVANAIDRGWDDV